MVSRHIDVLFFFVVREINKSKKAGPLNYCSKESRSSSGLTWRGKLKRASHSAYYSAYICITVHITAYLLNSISKSRPFRF